MLDNKFFSGRDIPQVDADSIEMDDWCKEQEHYIHHGMEYRGTRITGDHYHFLNFFKMLRVVDFVTNDVEWAFPTFSQEDDYIYKQNEEAYKSGMKTGLITGRGFGKSYLAINKAVKNFNFVNNSINIISASIDEAAKKTFGMTELCLSEVPEVFRQNRLRNEVSKGYLEAGIKTKEDGVETILGTRGSIRKVIYEDNAGKTRGDRPKFQLYEEIGAWTGSAKLIDCLNQSEGSFRRGSIITCDVWLIGTGGQMKTGGSEDAAKIFNDPLSYGVYACQEWYNKKTMIFMPAFKKYGGFYESTGISDEVGAKAQLEGERERKKGDQDSYMQFVQEYPFEPKEAFMTSGTKRFNQAKLQRQAFLLNTEPQYIGIVQEGRFWMKRDANGKGMHVVWGSEKGGPVKMIEPPEKDKDGMVYENLYICGVDSVDGDLKAGTLKNLKKNSSGDVTEISKLSCLIKKRFFSSQRSSNMYVLQITYRPENIDDAYEQVLMACMFYNCKANVEHTKIGIIKYFQQKKALNRLFKRPGICYQDVRKSRNSNDYGTAMDGAGKVIVYGLNSISKYIDSFHDNLLFLDLIDELLKFEDEERSKFDRVMAMMMTEIADDELMDIMVKDTKPVEVWQDVGYYTDEKGVRRFGAIPSKEKNNELFGNQNDIFVKNSRIN